MTIRNKKNEENVKKTVEVIVMLINFKVKNFLSYKEMTELSMVAGLTKKKSERLFDNTKYSLLKFSAIYGANASGKSNIVHALQYMKHIVMKGISRVTNPMYFKLDDDCKKVPTYFEVEIFLNGVNYAYGFEYDTYSNIFVSEWLINLDDSKSVFERDILNKKFESNLKLNDEFENKLKVYSDDLTADDTKLFLSFVYEKKSILSNTDFDLIINVADWFVQKIKITDPDDTITSMDYYIMDDKINEMASLLEQFDTGIGSVKKIEVDKEEAKSKIPSHILKRIAEDFKEEKDCVGCSVMLRSYKDIWIIDYNGDFIFYKILFYHENVPLTFENESDGTMRLLDLAEVLLTNKENMVYVIDELDRCLHPQVTCKFVKMFLELATKRNIQLIVTTHESRLLDFEILRRDEIWFANKKKGVSELYSLEEFNERFDKKIDKAYLDGRYGGVPIFDSVFPVDLNASSNKA